MNTALVTQLRIMKLVDMKPNFSELARLYDVDRRTVKKYYDGYEGKPKNRDKPSKLDKHYSLIKEKLAIKGTTIRAVYEFIKTEKDSDIGCYSNFHRYVIQHNLLPKQSSKGHPRFETPPGKQAQVDWKEDMHIANKYGELFTFQVFDYKLGHSRYCHFIYKTTKTRQDVFDCLIECFQATGGVPHEILFDNMASIVDLKDNSRHINNQMKSFADDFHFRIRLAKPRHPYTKGKVEVINKFLDWLRPYEGEFETEDELIMILEKITEKVNSQVNQATGVPPLLLFQKEKDYLQPVPNRKVMESYMRHDRQTTVQKDSLVIFNGSRYSVPSAYIGKTVSLKQVENKLYIYYCTKPIAMHTISKKKLNYLNEHYTDLFSSKLKDPIAVQAVAETNLQLMDDFL